MQHHTGAIWPDAVGTPTDPTAAYAVTGPVFLVTEETELACLLTVATADCDAIGLLAQITTDGGTNWRAVSRATVLGTAIGAHQASLSFPPHCRARILARRWGGTANTTLVVSADSRMSLGLPALDGQPLELAPHQVNGIECWGDGAGGAVVLAAGPGGHVPEPQPAANQQWLPTGEADTLVIDFTTTVLAPASIELEVRERPTGSAIEVEQPAVNSVVGGVVAQQIAQEQIIFGALDTRRSREIAVRPGTEVLVLAQRTGGGGTSEGYGVARFYKLGR